MSSVRGFLAHHRGWIAALVAVAAAGVVAGVLIAGGSGGADPGPASDAVEETQATQATSDDRGPEPSADAPQQRDGSSGKGREEAATATGRDDGARERSRDRSAGVLSSRNPLRSARRQGIEVLRATPEGADEILEALSGGGKDAPPAEYEELLEGQGK